MKRRIWWSADSFGWLNLPYRSKIRLNGVGQLFLSLIGSLSTVHWVLSVWERKKHEMENPFGGLTHSIYYPRPSLAVPVPPPLHQRYSRLISFLFLSLSLSLTHSFSLWFPCLMNSGGCLIGVGTEGRRRIIMNRRHTLHKWIRFVRLARPIFKWAATDLQIHEISHASLQRVWEIQRLFIGFDRLEMITQQYWTILYWWRIVNIYIYIHIPR